MCHVYYIHLYTCAAFVTYRYIITPARDSICSHGIHSPLRGPNSWCTSLLSVMSLFCFFPLSLHVPLCHCSHPFHYPALLLYTVPLYLVSWILPRPEVGRQSEYQVDLLASISRPLSSPALNSQSRLGLRFSWAKCNTLAVSPLFPFSLFLNSRPVSCPDPVPCRGIKFHRPWHALYSIFRLLLWNRKLLICLTLLRKDPAVLHETLSKPGLLKESWISADTDLGRPWRFRQSSRPRHSQCLQWTLKGISCSHPTLPTWKKARISLPQFKRPCSRHRAPKLSNYQLNRLVHPVLFDAPQIPAGIQ